MTPAPYTSIFTDASGHSRALQHQLQAHCPRGSVHTIVPNTAPTPAVTPIANAPQNVTRIAPTVTFAPPAPAANAPKRARNTSDVPGTTIIKPDVGAMAVTKRGAAAPTAKLLAEANAAWIGRAWSVSEMPSSSRACAPNAS